MISTFPVAWLPGPPPGSLHTSRLTSRSSRAAAREVDPPRIGASGSGHRQHRFLLGALWHYCLLGQHSVPAAIQGRKRSAQGRKQPALGWVRSEGLWARTEQAASRPVAQRRVGGAGSPASGATRPNVLKASRQVLGYGEGACRVGRCARLGLDKGSMRGGRGLRDRAGRSCVCAWCLCLVLLLKDSSD